MPVAPKTMKDYATPNSQRVLLGTEDRLWSQDGQYSAYINKGAGRPHKAGVVIKKKGSDTETVVLSYNKRTCVNCYGFLRIRWDNMRLELVQARNGYKIASQTYEDKVTPDAWRATRPARYLKLMSFSDGACLFLTDCSGLIIQETGTSSVCPTWFHASLARYGCDNEYNCGTSYCTDSHMTPFTQGNYKLTYDEESESGNDTVVDALLVSGGLVFALLMMVIGCVIYRRRRKAKKVFMEEVADDEDADEDAGETMVETKAAKDDQEQEQEQITAI